MVITEGINQIIYSNMNKDRVKEKYQNNQNKGKENE